MNKVPARSYAFYMAITEVVLALMARARRDNPEQLRYDGLDLSHALEAALYFTGVHDPGLLLLHENPVDVSGVSRLGSPLARLIALQGFAQGAALRAVHRRNIMLNTVKDIWRSVRPRVSDRHVALEPEARAAPILFLGRSPRFTRYLIPLAETLRGECAFLVPAVESEVLAMVCQRGFPCQVYGPGDTPQGNMGRMISDYGRQLASEAQAFADVLTQMNAKLVVVPEGNAPHDEILARVAEKHGIASACVQQGWSPFLHPAFHNFHYDVMLVWGEGFADLLAFASPRQRYLSTGNFHLSEPVDGAGAGILFLLQGFDDWLGGRHGAEAMLALVEGVAEALPERAIFVRPHPVVPLPNEVRTRLKRLSNIYIESPIEVSLAQAFAKSCISVSAYSTAILESIAAGVVPLIFNTAGIPRYWPDVAEAGAGLEIREPAQALQVLIALARDERARLSFQGPMAAFSARFFRFRGRSAVLQSSAALRQAAGLPAH